jgi:hypothetical protein
MAPVSPLPGHYDDNLELAPCLFRNELWLLVLHLPGRLEFPVDLWSEVETQSNCYNQQPEPEYELEEIHSDYHGLSLSFLVLRRLSDVNDTYACEHRDDGRDVTDHKPEEQH